MIAETVRDFVAGEVRQRLADDDSSCRLVVFGLPRHLAPAVTTHLREVFHEQDDGVENRVHVYHVVHSSGQTEEGGQGASTWEYVLKGRNSIRNLVTIADPGTYDAMPESIANTTTQLGVGRLDGGISGTLESRIIQHRAAQLELDYDELENYIDEWLDGLEEMSPAARHAVLWESIRRFCETETEHPSDVLHFAFGLPRGGDKASFPDANKVVQDLVKILQDESATEGFARLRDENPDFTDEVDALQSRFMNAMMDDERALPAVLFQADSPDDDWWQALDVETLKAIVAPREPDSPMAISVGGSLDTLGCLRPAALVVRNPNLTIRVEPPEGTIPQNLEVHKLPQREVLYTADHVDGREVFNHEANGANLRLEAIAQGFHGRARVYVLDNTRQKCMAVLRGSVKTKLPRTRKKKTTQTLKVTSAGPAEIHFLCGSTVRQIDVVRRRQGDAPEDALATIVPDNGVAVFNHDLDGDDQLRVTVKHHSGPTTRLHLSLNVEPSEDETAHPSVLHALIDAHVRGKNRIGNVVPRRNQARLLEERLLRESESYRPLVLAANPDTSVSDLSWENGVLGDLPMQKDPRPGREMTVQPPDDYLEARAEVLQALRARGASLPDLRSDELAPLLVPYLAAYVRWLEDDAAAASWADTIAVLEPQQNAQAGSWTVSSEPIAILMTPLHPLRLAWMSNAQGVLEDGLDDPCPLLAVIDPHAVPDIMPAWLDDGDAARPHPFVSVPCEDAGWGLLWNVNRMRDLTKSPIVKLLARWGLGVPGLSEGLSGNQAGRAMDDAARLLAARATLRIGLVGTSVAGGEATEGVIEWIHDRMHNPDPLAPPDLEIHDARPPLARPALKEVAHAHEASDGRARWYESDASDLESDVILVDHLDLREPQPVMEPEAGLTAASPGLLYRQRIRYDRANASTLVESRIGLPPDERDDLAGLVEKCAFMLEELVQDQVTHVRFEPNLTAVQSWLVEPAQYVAVSSSEMDIACFARGAETRGGYLWEYSLPDVLEAGTHSAGYFLLARANPTLVEAVSRQLAALGCPAEATTDIISEISRRGIPLLKRLAAGGSAGKGELGTFLTARLIQDCFRDDGVPKLPVIKDDILTLIVPIDPYAAVFNQIRKKRLKGSAERRADLMIVQAQLGRVPAIRVSTLETKWREGTMSDGMLREASKQASEFGNLLQHLWHPAESTDAWDQGGRMLLAHIVDQTMRLYGDPRVSGVSQVQWSEIHSKIIQAILNTAPIEVDPVGYVIAFDGGDGTRSRDLDEDGTHETLCIGPQGASTIVNGHFLDDDEAKAALRGWGPFALCASLANEDHDNGGTDEKPDERKEIPERLRWAIDHVEIAFKGFIGNAQAVQNVQRDLKQALLQDYPELGKNYLLTGNPSTGKTELARRMAEALELPFVHVDGTSVESRRKLFDLVDAKLEEHGEQAALTGKDMGLDLLEYPPFVVLIDEVHLCNRKVQEALLTLLEPTDKRALLRDAVVKTPRATFILATTRPTDVDGPLRTRCTEIRLRPYSIEEVSEMLQYSHPKLDDATRKDIARLSRAIPRAARIMADDVMTEAEVSVSRGGWHIHLNAVRKSRGMAPDGITEEDLEYMRMLQRAAGPVGERSLLASLASPDKDRLRFDVEPFLADNGFIELTPRGRILTAKGRDRLLEGMATED